MCVVLRSCHGRFRGLCITYGRPSKRICIASNSRVAVRREVLHDDAARRLRCANATFAGAVRAGDRLAARWLDPDDRLHGALSALCRVGFRAVARGRRRQPLPRLPGQLHLADPRPRPPGRRRRGRGAGPPRVRLRGTDRDRGRARRGDPPPGPLDRAPAVHQLRHRGDDVRHPGGARVHRPAARSRSSSAPTTARTTGSWSAPPGVPEAMAGSRRRAAVGRSGRHRGGPARPRGRPRRDHRRARPGRRRGPRAGAVVPAVPARPRRPGRRAADLRRDHLVPGRARRRAGALRRPAGPDDPRQDHRRRLSAGGLRRPGGRHGDLRRATAGRGQPWRHVQRQPGRGGSRAGHAPRADARDV